MKKMSLQEKKAWVIGLMVECPLGNALDTCPGNGIRKLPFVERLKIANKMTKEQLDKLISYHRDCIKRREKQLLK
ncbi:MAG: hypothetical protein U9O87_03475 [Verrucomicrobiota bacterium]|nr:hypothetical protein [Verrucomicrobiota bacterium]